MIVVTGGTHGIGRACVELFGGKHLRTIFTGRDEEAGRSIEATVSGATYVPCDVTVEASCERVIAAALDLGSGQIAGLVNNAGMSSRVTFMSSSTADWDHVMN